MVDENIQNENDLRKNKRRNNIERKIDKYFHFRIEGSFVNRSDGIEKYACNKYYKNHFGTILF